MADQDTLRNEPQSYRRETPHLTQAPINDVEPEYATLDHYTTLSQQRGRRHMGTASSDPEYLPQTEFQRQQAADPDARQTPIRDAKAPQRSGTLHYDRYLQTPKARKSIFASQQARRQQRTRTALVILLVAVIVVLALVWFLFLR